MSWLPIRWLCEKSPVIVNDRFYKIAMRNRHPRKPYLALLFAAVRNMNWHENSSFGDNLGSRQTGIVSDDLQSDCDPLSLY
jgi:hypothetical protein